MGITPERWERVKVLYEAAVGCAVRDREAFVLEKEADREVRTEVLRLLKEQEKLGSFLSTPAVSDLRDEERRMSVGEMLAGRFRILDFIAAGGMGEVYKAGDTRLDRTVALKLLPKALAEDRSSLERLRREAKAASSLNHPNICTVYDFGEDAGRAFIAMEYLEGEALSAHIKKGPLPLDKVLEIAIPVGSALCAAHRKGIIHRDLKPSNIMLTDTGAKLLDFGLAKYERPLAASEETVTMRTGEAHVVGTLPYMSPEQLQGREIDARSDIFAFGAVLYEMVTGSRAFQRQSNSETIIAVNREEPKPVHEFVKDVPKELERTIRRCLRKDPDDRYASVSEIERELEDFRALVSQPASGFNPKVLLRQSKRPGVAIPALLIMLTLTSLLSWWIYRSSMARWARDQAVPQIAKLVEQEKIGEAYTLAVQAERYIPNDPTLGKFWTDISWSASIHTVPSDVLVYRRNYNAPNSTWVFVGRSPIEKERFPLVDSRWKFELKGFATVERATFASDPESDPIRVTMDEDGKVPARMVRVELPTSESFQTKPVRLFGLSGHESLPGVLLSNYWIDKFEVTNTEFKTFVDQGGYRKQEYWKQEFRKDGHVLSWADAMRLFQDRTGRPGPATWIQGEYPPGQGNYPVTGVSWFEAAAFAEFSGKSLPTIYHWIAAASPEDGPSLVLASNFGGAGPAPAGTYQGISWSGAYDMAGNVREWIWNEASSGERYILGGAWNEPTYALYGADARAPLDRETNTGFRCAKYALTDESAKAAQPIPRQGRDYSSEKPVSDQLFRVYKSLYSYDKTPLHAVVESLQETDYWKEEKITFDAAYGSERIIAYLFLPKKASPPFQTVVHAPGVAAFFTRSSANITDYLDSFDFIVKSGRAVMFPVYKGMFERWDDFKRYPKTTNTYRDHVIDWSKDLGRSIDYLETRPDINHNKLAYEGFSWGAANGLILPALENRLKALILISAGLFMYKQLPETDQLNFVPRIKAPVLMLNGRFDFTYPVDSSQEPMFRLLGTPQEHKRWVVYDAGHDIPRTEMIKESLNWLDRYLGPVQQKQNDD